MSTDDIPNSRAIRPKTPPAWPAGRFAAIKCSRPEFSNAMVQLYQAEMQRANTWRTRLDHTTQWSVVATGAALLFGLHQPAAIRNGLILSTLFVSLFLWIESRRYRYYELWSHRVRLMETDFFAAMLVPPFAPSPEWAESLAESLLQPIFRSACGRPSAAASGATIFSCFSYWGSAGWRAVICIPPRRPRWPSWRPARRLARSRAR